MQLYIYIVEYISPITGEIVSSEIEILKSDEYVIDINEGYYVSLLHKTLDGYEMVRPDRWRMSIDGNVVVNDNFEGTSELDYKYFCEFNGIQENETYFVEITMNIGDNEVKYKGNVTVKSPH